MTAQFRFRAVAEIAQSLMAGGKGLLAMDESSPTCNKRLAALGISQNEEVRRTWRELIVTTPKLADSISGAILHDETIHQRLNDGRLFAQALADMGIVAGIKVDTGAKFMAGHPGETVTEGLDDLRERLVGYVALGARFAKWRAVIATDENLPSTACIAVNTQALARYAALCREAGKVPIVEAEVLTAGDHTLNRYPKVTTQVLHSVFGQLHLQGVLLDGLVLKPNMVLPGLGCTCQDTVDKVADATVNCLVRHVPAAVPGIAFLSGGQSGQLATARLNAMNLRFRARAPWSPTFSFSRGLQYPALDIWRGESGNVQQAQRALQHGAACNSAARCGDCTYAMEHPV